MSIPLPERPDLGQLKKQAKDLLAQLRAGNADALARADITAPSATAFALHDAQRILARDYGFASWARLKLHVATREDDAAEVRLTEAVLEGEPKAVAVLLAERPALATRSASVAAAWGDEPTIASALARNPAQATERGGPRQWPLLLYVCFGRCGHADADRARVAQRLLAGGADPNASWIHPDWPKSPLPALYGATGVNDYPQLARVLLQAGANPNDGESRYHAAEHHHVASLEVLQEFGADFSNADRNWGNTPLYFLFGYVHPPSAARHGVRWLLEHGANPNVRSHPQGVAETALHAAVRNAWDPATIELLLQHGADPALRRADGRSAYALAVCLGREAIAGRLRAHGAPTDIAPADEFLGACMRGDASTARALLATKPAIRDAVHGEIGPALATAARDGRAGAIEAIASLGFDVNTADAENATPLHWAAWHGRVEAVKTLLAHGADQDARDRRFNAPPIGWCDHGSVHCGNRDADYPGVATALLDAGAVISPDSTVSPALQEALARRAPPKS